MLEVVRGKLKESVWALQILQSPAAAQGFYPTAGTRAPSHCCWEGALTGKCLEVKKSLPASTALLSPHIPMKPHTHKVLFSPGNLPGRFLLTPAALIHMA